MSKFLSGRQSNLKLGISGYTESKTVLQTTGKVGIGTTDAQNFSLFVVGPTNITDTLTVAGQNVTGVATFSGSVNYPDNVIVSWGDSQDLKVYHDSSGQSYIKDTGTGDLNLTSDGTGIHLQSSGGSTLARFYSAGPSEIHHVGSRKLHTTTGGVEVTGLTDTDSLNVSGQSTFNTVNVTGVSTFANNVEITGDLTVSGTRTFLNTTELEVQDINIGIASADPKLSNAALDGAGIIIYGNAGDKTLTWNNANSRMEFNTDLYSPNFFVGGITASGDVDIDGHTELDNVNVSGVSTFTGAIDANGDLDVDGHTELDQLNVSGVSTFAGLIDANDGINATTAKVEDLTNNRIVVVGVGGELEDDANLTFDGSEFNVGSAITAYAATGIVSATAFYGDGSNLQNTGATLSATSGVERLVTTQLTSGTMVNASTDSDLTFDAGNNTLNTENLKVSGGISTNGSSYGQDGQLLRSTGTGWEWRTVPGIYSVNNILNGFNVLEEGGTVGTAGSIHTLDFRGINVFASGDPQPNGIATITFSSSPSFTGVNLTGVSTITGTITAGSSEGVVGQYLRHVGTGVTWASFPTLRTTQTNTATAGQTAFNFNYNVDFLDVFVNGVKLSSSEYTATNGNQIVLDTPAFVGETVEFHSYNVASTYGGGGGGGGGASNLNGLTDVTIGTLADNQLLQYNSSSGEWENVNISSAGVVTSIVSNTSDIVSLSDSNGVVTIDVAVGAGGTWATDLVGINTVKNVGIGTTAKDGYKLYVEGDARVTGILTVGPASVTIDGINNTVTANSFVGSVSGSGNSVLCTTVSAGASVTANQFFGDASNVTGIVTTNLGKANVTIGDNPPGIGTASGDLWWESDTAKGHIYYNDGSSAQWVEFNPSSGGGGGGGGGSYGNADVDSHLNVSGASSGQILSWTGSDYAWVADQTGGGGIALTDLSVTQNSVGTAALAYNNSNGVFSYTPPDLSSYQQKTADGSALTGIVTSIVAGTNVTVSNTGGIYTINSTGSGGISNVVEDTTPQLGGDLDLNSNNITGNGNISINGTASITGSSLQLIDNNNNDTYIKMTSGITSISHPAQSFYPQRIATTNQGIDIFKDVSIKDTSNTEKFNFNTGSGTLTANFFSGDGSNLTNVSAGSTDLVSTYNLLSTSHNSAYFISGPGITDTTEVNPTLYLTRGQTYKVYNGAGTHPFRIQYQHKLISGATVYSDGITGNQAGSGATLYWEVPFDAPGVLYYQCSSHINMSGKIIIMGDVVSEGSWTASAGSAQTIDTITGVANNAIKTAEYVIHIENGSNMQAQKVLVMQDGTTAYSQEYAIMHKSGLLVSMSATISGGNLLLQATPETGVSGTTTYKITRQTMR